MKKEFIFLGPPACGKGTQTDKLSKYLGFPHIDTGSLLRAEISKETEEGKIAKSFIDKDVKGDRMYSNALRRYRCYVYHNTDLGKKEVEEINYANNLLRKYMDDGGRMITEYNAIKDNEPFDNKNMFELYNTWNPLLAFDGCKSGIGNSIYPLDFPPNDFPFFQQMYFL